MEVAVPSHAALLLLCTAALALAPAVSARSQYASAMPHGNDVPGCSAIGHGDCSGGSTNAFGDAFDRAGLTWTHAVCAADSDGDGFSNGDELGDVCCWWTGDGTTTLLDAVDTTQPGSRASKPTGRASCLITPPPPTNVDLVALGGSRAELHWTAPPITSACVCFYELHVALQPQPQAAAGSVNATAYTLSPVHVAQASSFVLCGLTPNTTYTVTARAVSVGGSSSWAVLNTQSGAGAFTTLLTNTTMFDLNSTVECSTITALGGAWPTTPPTLMATPVVALLIVTVVACACGPVVLYRCCRRVRGSSDTACVESLYDTCVLTPVLAPPRSAAGGFVCGDVSHLSVGAALVVSVFVTLLALRGVYSYEYWHAVEPERMEWGRIPADMAQLTLAFAFAPLWKHSLWAQWAGLSYDALLTFHRWLGAVTVLLVMCHGCGMLLVYAGGNALGTSVGLYGFLAGCGMAVIGVTSLPPVRRASYRLFALAHWLFVPTLFLALLHNSDTIAWLVPAMVLGAIDFAFLLRDLCRSVRVTHARVWLPSKGTLGNSFVELQLNVDSATVDPAHAPFVLLYVPSLSLVPHPFSCIPLAELAAANADANNAAAGRSGARVRLLMKVVGPFTRRVVDDILAHAHADAHAAAPALSQVHVARAINIGVNERGVELQAPAPGPAPAAGSAAGSVAAGSVAAGSVAAGSVAAGSAAGSAVAGSAVAGSAVAGSAVAGSAVAGSAGGVDIAPALFVAPGSHAHVYPLWRASDAFANRRRHVSVFGPFGKPKIDVLDASYAAVLLVAGGVGVTPLLSLAHAVLKPNTMSPAANNAPRAVAFHWTYRSPDDDALWHALESTTSSLFGCGMGGDAAAAEMVVYRTTSDGVSAKHTHVLSVAAAQEGKAAATRALGAAVLPAVQAPGGAATDSAVLKAAARMRMMPAGVKLRAADLIQTWRQRFRAQDKPVRIAVAVCGPDALTEDVRRACSRAHGHDNVTFDLHTEAFGF